MKILRFGEPGKEKPGVLINNEIIDVSSFGEDYGEIFFDTNGLERNPRDQGSRRHRGREQSVHLHLRAKPGWNVWARGALGGDAGDVVLRRKIDFLG